MSACLFDSGCSFDDQLAAMRFQAETCGQSTRNRGPLLSAVTYTLFGVSTIFTIARALSRWPKFGGAGFGWDDGTGMSLSRIVDVCSQTAHSPQDKKNQS